MRLHVHVRRMVVLQIHQASACGKPADRRYLWVRCKETVAAGCGSEASARIGQSVGKICGKLLVRIVAADDVGAIVAVELGNDGRTADSAKLRVPLHGASE